MSNYYTLANFMSEHPIIFGIMGVIATLAIILLLIKYILIGSPANPEQITDDYYSMGEAQ